jgi:fermentation-respiration switch protein FrsA (DUF1100 family)
VAILYHGNAGSACDRAFFADLFTQAGYGYVIVEYEGYSNDGKTPSHDGVKRDVKNVIDFILERHLVPTVVGVSIGTGAASHHASLLAPEKLVLISPFTDLDDVARSRFWFYPTWWMVDNAFDNVTALAAYQNPLLIIHGDSDTIIPYKFGQQLYERVLTTQKSLVTIEGAGHNNLFSYEQTYETLSTFLHLE